MNVGGYMLNGCSERLGRRSLSGYDLITLYMYVKFQRIKNILKTNKETENHSRQQHQQVKLNRRTVSVMENKVASLIHI